MCGGCSFMVVSARDHPQQVPVAKKRLVGGRWQTPDALLSSSAYDDVGGISALVIRPAPGHAGYQDQVRRECRET